MPPNRDLAVTGLETMSQSKVAAELIMETSQLIGRIPARMRKLAHFSISPVVAARTVEALRPDRGIRAHGKKIQRGLCHPNLRCRVSPKPKSTKLAQQLLHIHGATPRTPRHRQVDH